MTNLVDTRIVRSREALIRAGMILFAENGDASLSDVAQVAGVGRATLYRHFATREELVEAIAVECFATFSRETAMVEMQASSYLDALGLLFEKVMPLQRELTYIMKLEALINDTKRLEQLFEAQDQELKELLLQCQKECSIRNDYPLDWLMAMLDGLFIAAWRMINEFNTPHEKAAKLAFQTFCQGVAVRD